MDGTTDAAAASRQTPYPLSGETTRALDHLLAVEQAEHRLPSLAAGLVRDGALVWSGARGTVDGRADGQPATVDTQYRMGSITKTFVAVGIMRLRDAGRIDLEDRFEEHVPGTGFGRATIAQLLAHSSGLQAETNGPWWERTEGGSWDDLVATGIGQRMRAGRRHHYTNVGFGALGELLARAHGRGWFEVVTDEILAPLGMTRTSTRPIEPAAQGLAVHPFADIVLPEPEHDAGAMAPAGQLWTTVEDLARYAAFWAGAGGADEILARDTVEEMCEPQVIGDAPGQPWQSAHGLGVQLWNVEGRRYVGHGGSMPGFLAGLRVSRDTGDGVVVFANSTSGMGRIGPDLLELLDEREPVDPPAWSVAPTAADALELVGLWHWGPSVFMCRATGDGGLELGTPGQGRGSRFRRLGVDEYVGLDGYYTDEPLVVVRDGTGAVSHLDLASFRFTRLPYDPTRDIPGGVHESGWTH